MRVTLTVNGKPCDLDLEPHRTLATTLRQDCASVNVPHDCADGTCGACTVLLDGEATRSCLILGVQCDGAQVRTVEGLAVVFPEHTAHGAVCVPGLVMLVAGGLAHNPDLADDPEALHRLLASNVCRRGDHEQIEQAVVQAATKDWILK